MQNKSAEKGSGFVSLRRDKLCGERERLSLLFSQEGKLTTLIETRGNGGLILCSPGDGYELIQGDYTQLSVLTVEEREILLNAAWHFDEKPMTGSSTEPISLNSTNENDFSDCSSGRVGSAAPENEGHCGRECIKLPN